MSCYQSSLSSFQGVVHDIWYCCSPFPLIKNNEQLRIFMTYQRLSHRTHNEPLNHLTRFWLIGNLCGDKGASATPLNMFDVCDPFRQHGNPERSYALREGQQYHFCRKAGVFSNKRNDHTIDIQGTDHSNSRVQGDLLTKVGCSPSPKFKIWQP